MADTKLAAAAHQYPSNGTWTEGGPFHSHKTKIKMICLDRCTSHKLFFLANTLAVIISLSSKMKVKQTQSLTLTVLLGLASTPYFASARAGSSTSTPSLRQHTRIINGTTAEDGRYNYFVSFQDEVGLCGGSLVAADVVLTAAHCESPDWSASWAVIRRHDLDDISEGTVIPVEESLPHPNYDSTTADNDFMLLFLRDPAPQDAAFVKLNSDPNVPAAGDYVTVMGHGVTEPDGMLSMELLEVEINVVSTEECEESHVSIDEVITDNMLCAADIGKDSCQGDSGGPLVIKGNDVHGSDDVQVGVVSWGIDCAHPEYAGVYSRVSSAFDWIRQEVCTRSMYPPAEFDCDFIIPVPTFTPTLEPPTSSPTISSQPTTTKAPTVSCPPPYDSSFNYVVGDRVNFGEQIFICQPHGGSDRCADDSSVWSHVKACCPPVFDDTRTDYQAYDKVSSDGIIFQCQPGAYEEYCNIHKEDWGWNETQWDLYINSWSYVGEC